MDAPRTLRVLFIASGAAPTPRWRHGAHAFDMVRVFDLDGAAENLERGGIDAVVLDADFTDRPAEDLHRLIAGPARVAALIMSDDAGACAGCPAGCTWLPASAPAAQQAALIHLAAHCSLLQQEAERNDARFRDVIERNADALVVMNESGTILFANRMAVELFGQPRAELIGSPFGFPAVAGETTELDLHANGHARVVEMRVVESEWEGSAACIASLRDITHRKQAEEIARGLIREQAARSVAESAARRFRFLADSSTVLSSSLDFRITLSELARLCVSEIAEWAVIYIVDDGNAARRLEVAHRDETKRAVAEALRTSTVPLRDPHPVLDVLRTRLPMLVRNVDEALLTSLSEDAQQVELIRQLGVTSFMVVPLTARDRSLGAIALVTADEQRPFGEDDLELAEDLALRAALAVDNARLYRTAQEVNQTKSDLFAAISHDLRTPLNSIIGHVDLLCMGIPEPLGGASLRHVERIGRSANHLIHLIDELLTLVRLEAGRVELDLAHIAISELVTDVTEVVELLASERGLAFHTRVSDPGMGMLTDPARLRQVLLNLVGNAIKYTERGSVRLDVTPAPDGIAFAVTDTGVGIAADDLEKMFEPFWQADGARRNADKGTGLGLSVVQRLVALLGGRIRVESEIGRGSTFTVLLPARHPHSDAAGEPAADAAEALDSVRRGTNHALGMV